MTGSMRSTCSASSGSSGSSLPLSPSSPGSASSARTLKSTGQSKRRKQAKDKEQKVSQKVSQGGASMTAEQTVMEGGQNSGRRLVGHRMLKKSANVVSRVVGILGVLCTAGGAIILLKPYLIPTWDQVAWAMVIAGACMVVLPWLLTQSVLSPEEGKVAFSFKRLNDESEADVKQLELLLEETAQSDTVPSLAPNAGDDSVNSSNGKPLTLRDLPRSLRKQWLDTQRKENQVRQKAKEAAIKQRTLTLEEALKSGTPTNMLLEKYFLKKRVYVAEFDGDPAANPLPNLRSFVNLMLTVASDQDEVVVKLTSPGGMVPQYGLAAAQLNRLRQAGILTTVCVDTVAASGGYMMACVAHQIVASPFAYVGSIGVVAEIPNFHKLLNKHDVDYHLFTAGKFKRTVTMFSEVTHEQKDKFQSDLGLIHDSFKAHVQHYRGERMDVDAVATGEYWLGSVAKEKGMVDQLMTSDDYLRNKCNHNYDVILVSPKEKSRLLRQVSEMLTRVTLFSRQAFSLFMPNSPGFAASPAALS